MNYLEQNQNSIYYWTTKYNVSRILIGTTTVLLNCCVSVQSGFAKKKKKKRQPVIQKIKKSYLKCKKQKNNSSYFELECYSKLQ